MYFLLLLDIDACSRVSLLVVPNGLDFDEHDGSVVTCNDVEFPALVGVVPCENAVAFAHQERCCVRFDEISLGTVGGLHLVQFHTEQADF